MANTTYERAGAAAVLTITRRERRNSVDADTAAEMLDAYRRFESDADARVLVLTGEGPEAFCAGADLKAVAERGAAFTGDDPQSAVDAWLDAVPAGPLGFTRLTSTKPTIAAVSGWCLAGGLELASWCDLRICTESGRFGYPERRWGVPLIDGGTQRLPLVVGMGRALELILTGRIIDAAEAHTWGLVNEVVNEGGHVTRALEIAEALASFPQETMLSDRAAAIEGAGLSLDEGLALEERLGRPSVITGVLGAARFAGGEGRGGEGAGA
ncbi:MAG: enoyl-CoA hydratase-related protein [Aeromicrobium sp.]